MIVDRSGPFVEGVTSQNPSSLFSCICGLNYFKDLVGICVPWGLGWLGVWIGVGIRDMCGRVHAITEAFSKHISVEWFLFLLLYLRYILLT